MNGVSRSAAPSAQTNFRLGHPFEYALGDHVHQVIQVVQRHEADVLLVGPRGARRRRRERDARARPRCAPRPAGSPSTAASHSGQNCGLPYSSRDCSGTPICTTRGWSLVLLDLAQRAGDVVGIDPDGAAEPVAVLRRRRASATPSSRCGAAAIAVPEVAVRHDAAGHRVQDRDVDAALVEQVLGRRARDPNPGTAGRALGALARTRRRARRTSPSRSRGTRGCGTARA